MAVAAASLDQDHSDLRAKFESAVGLFRTRQQGLTASPLQEQLPAVEVTVLAGDFDELAGELREHARAIEAGDFPDKIEEIAKRRGDLGARIALAGVKATLVAERDRLLARRCIEDARKQTTTTGLTTKVGELTRKYVTAAVQDRFSRESDRLRVEGVTLQDKKGRQGTLLHKPGLHRRNADRRTRTGSLRGRADSAGLAGFFTEAHFDRSRSTLVLDDPVTSLDHERRGRVAERLVELAKNGRSSFSPTTPRSPPNSSGAPARRT